MNRFARFLEDGLHWLALLSAPRSPHRGGDWRQNEKLRFYLHDDESGRPTGWVEVRPRERDDD